MAEEFENFADVLVLPTEVDAITPHYPERDGKGVPTALLLVLKPIDEVAPHVPKMRVVMRFRSRRGFDAFFAAMLAEAEKVWPSS